MFRPQLSTFHRIYWYENIKIREFMLYPTSAFPTSWFLKNIIFTFTFCSMITTHIVLKPYFLISILPVLLPESNSWIILIASSILFFLIARGAIAAELLHAWGYLCVCWLYSASEGHMVLGHIFLASSGHCCSVR